MHRVLPECTYGLIPKVQGALGVFFVSPVPAVLEPVRIPPERYGFTRRANGEAKRTQGRQVSYACSAFVTRCIEAMLRASWKKTIGYCWRTQKCRDVGLQHVFFEGKKAGETCARKSTSRTLKSR